MQYEMKRLKSSMILGKLLSKSFPQAILKSLCCPFKWGKAIKKKKKRKKPRDFFGKPQQKILFFFIRTGALRNM